MRPSAACGVLRRAPSWPRSLGPRRDQLGGGSSRLPRRPFQPSPPGFPRPATGARRCGAGGAVAVPQTRGPRRWEAAGGGGRVGGCVTGFSGCGSAEPGGGRGAGAAAVSAEAAAPWPRWASGRACPGPGARLSLCLGWSQYRLLPKGFSSLLAWSSCCFP